MSTLRFDAVSVVYGTGRLARTAVDAVSLEVEAGTTLGLVGESGSGKSTLTSTAVGLVPLARGRVLLGDDVIAGDGHGPRGARRRIQMVFQDPLASLDPRMTVGEAISEAFRATGRRVRAGERRTRVAELLDLVRLGDVAPTAYPAELSGGMRQRVAIARALAAEPEVIIADEVTSALDVSVQAVVLNLLRELQRELGLTLVFVSHNLAVTRYMSDRIAVMRDGRIVEDGAVDHVVGSPETPYVQELLDAVPVLGRRWTKE